MKAYVKDDDNGTGSTTFSPTVPRASEELPLPIFAEFKPIPRLFRQVVVTEKIDGTNACVHVLEDGRVLAASRSRYITPSADNFGFASWVKTHEEELRQLGAGRHYGEWYGSGIQRGYGLLNGERRFALFNTGRWWSARNEAVMRHRDDAPLDLCMPPDCCEVVPMIAVHDEFDTARIHATAMLLQATGSLAVEGFKRPEGIVIYHKAANQLFKFTLEKNDGHKGAR